MQPNQDGLNQFNRQSVGALRDEINATLLPLAKKHGIKLEIGNISFEQNRFTAKLHAEVEGAEPAEAALYRRNQSFMRLPELGSEITLRGTVYFVRGLKARGRNNILIERKLDGKVFVCPHTDIQQKLAPTLTLDQFAQDVNRLQKAECDRINSRPENIFGAEFIPLPTEMLAHYHRDGMTPQEALDRIAAEVEAEGRAEALAS